MKFYFRESKLLLLLLPDEQFWGGLTRGSGWWSAMCQRQRMLDRTEFFTPLDRVFDLPWGPHDQHL